MSDSGNMPLFDRGSLTSPETDFAIQYLNELSEISKRYAVTAAEKFELECEIAAAAYILVASDLDRSNEDAEFEKLKAFDGGAKVALMAQGLLATLRRKGVNANTAKAYMDERLQQFEETLRRAQQRE